MAPKYKEHGGGPATGLGNDWVNFLSQGLNTGSFGAGNPAGGDAVGQTAGIAGVLNDILSGGAGNLGGSLSQLIQQDTSDQVNQLRSRFGASGGTAFGTGSQYAESVLRAKQAPQLANAIGNLQLGAVMQLLGLTGQTANKGITQRQGVLEESPWMTGFKIAAPIIGMGLSSLGAGKALTPGAQGAGATSMMGGIPGISDIFTNPMNSVMSPGAVSSIPVPWTPTLFDYGLR